MEGATGEPPIKKQRTETNIQVVGTATEVVTMTNVGQDQPVLGGGMSLISSNSNMVSMMAPKTYVAGGVKTIAMTPQGQVIGSSVRPGVNMTSVIRPSLQLQAIQSGQPKVIPGIQGHVQLRPGLVNEAASAMRPMVQYATPMVGQARPSMQLSASTIQQLSGSQKMTFQITPPGVRAIHPRSPITMAPRSPMTIPQVVAVAPGGVPRYTQIQTVPHAVPPGMLAISHANKGPVSSNIQIQAPTHSKIRLDQLNRSDQVNAGGHQIRVQVPSSKGNAVCAAKSLLEPPNKSPVSTTIGDSRSLLESKVVSCSNSVIQKTVPVAPDTKVIESKLLTSVQASQKLSQGRSSPPVIGSTIQPQKLTKSGSFIIQSGKPVTFVPSSQSSQVVTQIVKTDSKTTAGKVTMAEAQIMLPSGPAMISWPIPPKTTCGEGSKQYVMSANQIIRSVPTTGKLVVGKQVVSSASSSPTRPTILGSSSMSRIKVSGGGSPRKVVSLTEIVKDGGRPAVSSKSNVLPIQKNWELVKQSNSLLQPKSDSSNAVDPNSPTVTDANPQNATCVAISNSQNVTTSISQNVADSKLENTAIKVTPTVTDTVAPTVDDLSSPIVTDSASVISTDSSEVKANTPVSADVEEVNNPEVVSKTEDGEQSSNFVSETEPEVSANTVTGQVENMTEIETVVPVSEISCETAVSENENNMEHNDENELGNKNIEDNGDSMETKSSDNILESAIGNTNLNENKDSEIIKESSGCEKDKNASSETETETNKDASATDMKESMEVDTAKHVKESMDTLQEEVQEEAGEFDPVNAMEWSDGVAKLEGSNMKFRMNDLGILEMITDSLECTETLNTSNESEKSPPKATEVPTIKPDPDAMPAVPPNEKKMEVTEEVLKPTNKDEINQCENCGKYGFKTDFHQQGSFCGQSCLTSYDDDKRARDLKKPPIMSESKSDLHLKRNKKKVGLGTSLSEIKREPGTSGGRKVSKAFVWTKYLEAENAKEAPARLFKNAFPSAKNGFRVGMKLEGIDPEHQSLFCVLSVAEVCGHRIRLHFDGYSECFDFWTDIDSPYLFPVGFCEKNGKILQPPKGFTVGEFNWPLYQKITKGTSAPKSLFSSQLSAQSVTPSPFRVGCRLEAVDKKNSSLICVATISNTLADRLLVHFDGWEDDYDYWCDTTSPFLHPAGYCDSMGFVLSPPPDWTEADFTWDKYLAKVHAQSVPARAFKPRPAVPFEAGMKVELVDKRNTILVRVATILELENYMVKIHFDGWSDTYDYWLDDDSPELHPPGWCAKTGHPLVPPITPSDLVVTNGPGICPTPGCKGLGHIKGSKYSGHHSTFGCPYSTINMNKESVVGDRLGNLPRPEETGAQPAAQSDSPPSATETKPVTTHPHPHTQQNGDIVKKWGRGRRPKSYYQSLEEVQAARENGEEQEKSFRQGIHNSVFDMSSMVTMRNDSPLCWEQHSKLLPGVTRIHGNEVTKWTTDEVMEFVEQLPGCEGHAKMFKDEQIDGEAFLLLTQSDIVKIMNIKLGPALKIFNSIIMFKNSISI